ncbi:MAG: GreA/GreB family elongation factor, partial [Pseudonocardia sp.]
VLVTDEMPEDEQARVLTVDSPLGRALAGRRAGDTVVYRTPDGEASVAVVSVVLPSEEPSGDHDAHTGRPH